MNGPQDAAIEREVASTGAAYVKHRVRWLRDGRALLRIKTVGWGWSHYVISRDGTLHLAGSDVD